MGIYKLRTDFATHMKVLLWVVLVIFVVGAIWSFGAAPFIQKAKKKEVVMLVGERPVHRSDFEAEWDRIYKLAQQRGMKSPLEFANLKQMIVDNMIESQKLITVAEEEGIVITKKDVKAAKEEKIVEVLKQNRNAIMGDLDEAAEAVDPRKDKKFLKTLSENGMSIDSIISEANANVSDLSIKAELAQKQLQDRAEAKVKDLTKEDVKNSYKSFGISQIVVAEDKSTPEEAKANADKAYAELQGGADFDKVKSKYSTVQGFPGMEYNPVDMPWILPAKVGDAVKNLSEGKYTEVIKSDKSYYIVKVDKITDKAPANLDEKTINERKEAIKQSVQQAMFSEIQEKEDAIKEINVKDPEFNGYYHCLLAEKEMTPEASKGEYTKAVACFTEALKKDEQLGKEVINAKLADTYFKMGDYKKCNDTLYAMLDGKDSTTEAYDLRALYGDSLAKIGEKAKAIDQYIQAGMLNKSDAAFQDEMSMKLGELGAAQESAAAKAKANEIRDYEEKQQAEMMKKMQEEQAKEEAKKKAEENKKPEEKK